MFKRIFIATVLCITLSSCEGEPPRKYAAELRPKIHAEYIKQGICREDKSRMHGNDCNDVFFVGGVYTIHFTFYIPTEKFPTFDFAAILNMFNEIYIRDNVDLDIYFHNGTFGGDNKEVYRVRYYAYKK